MNQSDCSVKLVVKLVVKSKMPVPLRADLVTKDSECNNTMLAYTIDITSKYKIHIYRDCIKINRDKIGTQYTHIFNIPNVIHNVNFSAT